MSMIAEDEDAMDITARILKHGYCSGHHCNGKGIPQADHTCPFGEEIRDDHSLCNCCETCEHECAMDI